MGWGKFFKSFALPAIGIALGAATGGAAFGLSGMLAGTLGGAVAGGVIGSTANTILGLGGPEQPKMPDIPAAKLPDAAAPAPTPLIPAAPAPIRREDTGASVVLGSPTKDQRVSGGKSSIGKKVDVLGGLGLGGLRI